MDPSKLLAPVLATTLLLTASAARADEPPAKAIAEASDKDKDDDSLPVGEIIPRLPPSSVRLKLALGGVAVTGIAYAAAYGVTSNWPEVPGSAYLKAPVVGPWIALGKSGCASDDPNCSDAKIALRGILYVLDGLVQLGGLGMIGEAIFMKTEPDAAPKKGLGRAVFAGSALTVRPYPLVTPTVTGLGFVGTF
ncbi:MAG: hypothetical protein ABI193_20075 [Minicystis sp.]